MNRSVLRGRAAMAALAIGVWGVLAGTLPAAAQSADVAFSQQLLSEAGPELAALYAARGMEPIWTTPADASRRAAFFAALDSAAAHGLPAQRYGADSLRAAFAALRTERQRGALEAAMSAAFMSYADDMANGFLVPAKIDRGIVREVPQVDPVTLLRTFASAAEPGDVLRGLEPKAPEYTDLMRHKAALEETIAAGGLGARVPGSGLAPGESGPAVIALRDRLMAMGYLDRAAQATYDDDITRAVSVFQVEHGLTPTGRADEATLAEINRGPEERLASVLVAMERLRWMNGLELGSRHVWVNLPDFTARLVDDGKVRFETVTVVGMNSPDRRSPEFSDEMEHMVINPTWHVPRSITVKEYLPMLQKNPNAVRHLRIVDRSGRPVDRGAVDFTRYTAATFPYSMSQPPSDDNALGLVKFMFPNQYNIYLHDTPSKSLFEKEVRAYSHGCIRVGDPFGFAYALLERQTTDPVGLFHTNLENKAEHLLPLDEHVPVHIVYFTAWPTAKGRIEYRRDVYGRDARIFEAMIAAGVALPAVQG